MSSPSISVHIEENVKYLPEPILDSNSLTLATNASTNASKFETEDSRYGRDEKHSQVGHIDTPTSSIESAHDVGTS